MGVRQGHSIVATTITKETEINGLKGIIHKEVRKMLDKTADKAINDLQVQASRLCDRCALKNKSALMYDAFSLQSVLQLWDAFFRRFALRTSTRICQHL